MLAPRASRLRQFLAIACAVIVVAAMVYVAYSGLAVTKQVSHVSDGDSTANQKREQSGKNTNPNELGLLMKINIPSVVSDKEPLSARFILENHTEKEVGVRFGVPLNALHIEVATADGIRAPFTEAGEKEFPSGSLFNGVSGSTVLISPSDSHSWDANLTELFELPPGPYRITASVTVAVDGEKDLDIKSDAVTFTVK